MEPLEKQYESEWQILSAKKAKDDEERRKRVEEKARLEAQREQITEATTETAENFG